MTADVAQYYNSLDKKAVRSNYNNQKGGRMKKRVRFSVFEQVTPEFYAKAALYNVQTTLILERDAPANKTTDAVYLANGEEANLEAFFASVKINKI